MVNQNSDSKPVKSGRPSILVKGSLLREYRKQKGLTQEETAKAIGYSTRLIRKAEHNGPLDPRTLRDFAEFYSTADNPLSGEALIVSEINDPPEFAVREIYHRAFNEQDLSVIDEYFADDVIHIEDGVTRQGVEVIHERLKAILGAFSEMNLWIDTLAVQEPWRISNWSSTCVHTGEFMGIAPTNIDVTVRGSTWMRFENGKCVEVRDYWESQNLINQLTGVPPNPI